MRYGHIELSLIELSLNNKTMSAKLTFDCILIMEIESVRILGFPGLFACEVHLLPPNRPRPGIQTTHCTAHAHNASA